jgi:hypothetical protein
MSVEINSNCHTAIINTMTSHEFNAGYKPASNPSAWSAVRRQMIETAGTWEVKNCLLDYMSFNEFVWTELHALRRLYATTLLGFLPDHTGEVGRFTVRTGNTYHCVLV